MSSFRALTSALRGGMSVNVRRGVLAVRGGHAHRPPPPPFARLKAPAQPLHEEAELVWNDGVSPETLIDFDAPHIPKYQALRHWLCGLGFFVTLMGVVTLYGPDSWRQAVKRETCLPDLKWELGEIDEPEGEMSA